MTFLDRHSLQFHSRTLRFDITFIKITTFLILSIHFLLYLYTFLLYSSSITSFYTILLYFLYSCISPFLLLLSRILHARENNAPKKKLAPFILRPHLDCAT